MFLQVDHKIMEPSLEKVSIFAYRGLVWHLRPPYHHIDYPIASLVIKNIYSPISHNTKQWLSALGNSRWQKNLRIFGIKMEKKV